MKFGRENVTLLSKTTKLRRPQAKKIERLVGLFQDLNRHYGKTVSGKRRVKRSEGSARREKDLAGLVTLLNTVKPFEVRKGRCHTAFQNYKLKTTITNIEKLKAALLRGKVKWANVRQDLELREELDATR